MANIFLTTKCNLKCPYCFADEFVNKNCNEISVENFKKALAFIQTEEGEKIGLIGGEPTLHPHFREFIKIIQETVDNAPTIIFTNGLEIDKYIDDIKDPKFHLLINCNSPQDLGPERYEKLKNNIKLIHEVKNNNMALGINLYSPDSDYSFIFELCKMIGAHKIRFSTAIPNDSKENTQDILQSFKDIKSYVFSFFRDCLENDLVPSNDCNSFPDCFYTPEDKKLLLALTVLGQKYSVDRDTLHSFSICMPVIDILPDLMAVRCFGLSKYLKVPISEYKNILRLKEYFFNKIDVYSRLSFASPDCEDCRMRMFDKCGICFTYKLQKIEKLKEIVRQGF